MVQQLHPTFLLHHFCSCISFPFRISSTHLATTLCLFSFHFLSFIMRQLFALGRQMVFVIDGNLVEYRYSRNQCRRRALWHSFLYSRGRLVRAYAFDLTLWAGARRLSSNREQRVRSTDHMVFLLIDDSLPTSQHYEGNPIPGESIIRTHPWSKSILGPPSPRFFPHPYRVLLRCGRSIPL